MTPLVFVHGFMGGSAQWAAQAPLGEARPLVLVDLPGYGENAGMAPKRRITDAAAWVLDELSARGVERFDLLGHSMGGMIVQEMAHLAPERVNRLVLFATGAEGVLPGRFETIETSMERARRDGAEATARRIAATWFLDGEAAPGYAATAEIATRARLPAILAGLGAMMVWSGTDRLAAIVSRTLILWGDRDRTYPWSQIETLWRGIGGSALAVLPDCAHAVHAEKPERFNAVIDDFLLGPSPCRPGNGW